MLWIILGIGAGLLVVAWLLYRFLLFPWGARWGATAAECAAPMTGDDWCTPGGLRSGTRTRNHWRSLLARFATREVRAQVRADSLRFRPALSRVDDLGFRPTPPVRVTRAVSVAAPPEAVWPWLAQIGRGAGYYSYDRLDNGGRPSARHILTWAGPPRVGDATAIGYLRALAPGRELAWWMPPERLPGCEARMSVTYRVAPADGGSRVVARVSADGRGWAWPLLLAVFMVIDTLMMRRQLLGIRERAERHGTRSAEPERAETGARDQFQLYEFVGADGARAGVPGREKAAHWHAVAAAELGDRMGAVD